MRLPVLVLMSAGLLGSCGTFGQPTTFTLAELTQRCDSRGGAVIATGHQTGVVTTDYLCRADPDLRRASALNNAHRVQLNTAISRASNRF